MTENAKKFITPLTLATLSTKPVLDDASEWEADGDIKHINLGKWCYMLVIVPATANTMIKLHNGTADNLLTSTYLALPKDRRVVIFPAMNVNMWESTTIQNVAAKLAARYLHKLVEPSTGTLACGDVGKGKLPSVDTIVKEIEGHFAFVD
jgi:phosphopantothenoylcysteine decarboxylase/phosphopantothenate--cysteine ligase